MANSSRPQRLGDQIQSELSDIVRRRLNDPRHGFFTLTGVEMTRDLRQAKVYVSTLDPNDVAATMETLERAKGFLRTELGRRIRVRHLPELLFFHDESVEYGQRIQELLREIKEKEGSSDEVTE